MDALRQWPLRDLIRRALRERLVDDCRVEHDFVIIVQGSTRFVLDHVRAHAFLRGVLRGMSRTLRRGTPDEASPQEPDWPDANPAPEHIEGADPVEAVRRQIIRTWWDRYASVGCPFGRTISGLLMWIRYDTWETVN
jgi:hypothetical protein